MRTLTIGFLSLALLALAGCSEEDAQRSIEAAGYTEIRTMGFPNFACEKYRSPAYGVAFMGKNDKGELVRGAACRGYFSDWKLYTYKDPVNQR